MLAGQPGPFALRHAAALKVRRVPPVAGAACGTLHGATAAAGRAGFRAAVARGVGAVGRSARVGGQPGA
eukprot:5287705-Lingulodinium_polyedra.AAC.1